MDSPLQLEGIAIRTPEQGSRSAWHSARVPIPPPYTHALPLPPIRPRTASACRLHVVWEEMVNSGRITPSDFVRITSTAVAQTSNIYPRKVGAA